MESSFNCGMAPVPRVVSFVAIAVARKAFTSIVDDVAALMAGGSPVVSHICCCIECMRSNWGLDVARLTYAPRSTSETTLNWVLVSHVTWPLMKNVSLLMRTRS